MSFYESGIVAYKTSSITVLEAEVIAVPFVTIAISLVAAMLERTNRSISMVMTNEDTNFPHEVEGTLSYVLVLRSLNIPSI